MGTISKWCIPRFVVASHRGERGGEWQNHTRAHFGRRRHSRSQRCGRPAPVSRIAPIGGADCPGEHADFRRGQRLPGDETVEVSRSMADETYELPGLKVSQMRNRVAATGEAEWIAFVDADHEVGVGLVHSAPSRHRGNAAGRRIRGAVLPPGAGHVGPADLQRPSRPRDRSHRCGLARRRKRGDSTRRVRLGGRVRRNSGGPARTSTSAFGCATTASGSSRFPA